MHLAAQHGDRKTIEILLNAGADIETKDKLGYTSLHYAAQHGKLEAVEILFNAGADIEAKDEYSKTPSDLAAEYKWREVVEFLSEAEKSTPPSTSPVADRKTSQLSNSGSRKRG